MKKKSSILLVLILFVIFVMACVAIITGMEYPKCDIESLVLDEDKGLEGWQRGDEELYPTFLLVQDRLGAQQAFSNFMVRGNQELGHTVYQYSNRWLAKFHMWFDREIFFPSVGWEWSEMKGASNLSLHADQIHAQCGRSNLQYLDDGCVAVVRYGPYISDFTTFTQKEGMSTEEFKEFLLKIDELFRRCKD